MNKKNNFKMAPILISLLFFFICFELFLRGFILNSRNIEISMMIIVFFFVAIVLAYDSQVKINNEYSFYYRFKGKEYKSKDAIIDELNLYADCIIKNNFYNIKLLDYDFLKSDKMMFFLIQNEFSTHTDYIKNISGAVILLGLLGSFMGILESLKGVRHSIGSANYNPEGINTLFDDMQGIFDGVTIAFGTSILGIISSVFLSLIFTFYRKEEALLLNRIKSLILTVIVPHFKHDEVNPVAKMIDDSIKKVLPRVIINASESLSYSSGKLQDSTKSLEASVKEFKNIVVYNSEILLELKEINNDNRGVSMELKNSIKSIYNASEKNLIYLKENIATLSTHTKLVDKESMRIVGLMENSNKNIINSLNESNTRNIKQFSDKLELFNITSSKIMDSFGNSNNEILKIFNDSNERYTNKLNSIYNDINNSYTLINKFIDAADNNTDNIYKSYAKISNYMELKSTEHIITKDFLEKTNKVLENYLLNIDNLHAVHIKQQEYFNSTISDSKYINSNILIATERILDVSVSLSNSINKFEKQLCIYEDYNNTSKIKKILSVFLKK